MTQTPTWKQENERKKHLLRNERGKRFVFARKICGKQQQQHLLWLPGHPSPYIRVELSVCPRYFLFCGKSAFLGCDRPYPREIRLSLCAKGCFPLSTLETLSSRWDGKSNSSAGFFSRARHCKSWVKPRSLWFKGPVLCFTTHLQMQREIRKCCFKNIF